ncbi:MAG TPA: class I SAM-dependent rRNA methyltransferase [Polyangiaceae bacterium]|nr:class I SAM-dependent rRNA methyltransferase [Polyangiaceae bacterium]
MGLVLVKAGHVQPIWAGHPWVFAQAVARIEGGAQPGDEVEVKDTRGNLLGRGLYSPGSAIPVRIYTRDPRQTIDAALIADRIRRAVERRREMGLPSNDTDAVRLVHGEGDDLPGLIVDQLGDVLSIQIGTIGLKRREAQILDALAFLGARAVVDRTPARTAQAEGFEPGLGVVRGDAGLAAFDLRERGLRFRIPLELGQKTGFYADQRGLRARIEELSRGRSVLDTYCYVGAAALSAARGGATRVEAVDSSALAVEVGAACALENGLAERVRFERSDALEALAHAGRKGGHDLVICDPPKLAPTRAARGKAVDNMRRLAGAGARATRPGGLLVICSCSAAVGLVELGRALALGARDVGARAIVRERLFQGPDHPVPAAFPEGLYLTTLIAEVSPL